jgi:hypothetical protein
MERREGKGAWCEIAKVRISPEAEQEEGAKPVQRQRDKKI